MRIRRFISLLFFLSSWVFAYTWPGATKLVNATFGEIHGGNHFHKGIDIRSRYQPVYAIADGIVIEIDREGNTNYGIYIKIDHGNGKQSLYAHLKPKSCKVDKGDRVKAGQIIATSGKSGTDAPHLHFEMRRVVPTGRGSTVLYYVNPLKNHTYDWYLGSPEDEAAPVIGSHGNENKTFKSFLLYQGEGGRDEEGNINSFIGSADSTTIERSILG